MDNQQEVEKLQTNQSQQQTNENSSNPVGETNPNDTVIDVNPEETKKTESKEDGNKSKPGIIDGTSYKVEALKPAEKHMCMIDIKCSTSGSLSNVENFNREKVCRICHLSSPEHTAGSRNLIQLGCGCKDELGMSHLYCAETWFNHKGNRKCEVCGGIAKNVTAIKDTGLGIKSPGFRTGWNETRLMGSATNPSDGAVGSCLWSKHFCNFLLACLVLAFVLPWFFHINSV